VGGLDGGGVEAGRHAGLFGVSWFSDAKGGVLDGGTALVHSANSLLGLSRMASSTTPYSLSSLLGLKGEAVA
jgi:hypothetical protein